MENILVRDRGKDGYVVEFSEYLLDVVSTDTKKGSQAFVHEVRTFPLGLCTLSASGSKNPITSFCERCDK